MPYPQGRLPHPTLPLFTGKGNGQGCEIAHRAACIRSQPTGFPPQRTPLGSAARSWAETHHCALCSPRPDHSRPVSPHNALPLVQRHDHGQRRTIAHCGSPHPVHSRPASPYNALRLVQRHDHGQRRTIAHRAACSPIPADRLPPTTHSPFVQGGAGGGASTTDELPGKQIDFTSTTAFLRIGI